MEHSKLPWVARCLLVIGLVSRTLTADATSFELVRAPSLPIEMGLEQTQKLVFVVRNTGESIYLQNPSQDGAPNLTMTVHAADSLLRHDPGKQIYPFDIDITRSDTGLLSTDDERALTVVGVGVASNNPVFQKDQNTEISVEVQNLEPSRHERTKSLSMFLRFYDAQCAYKLNQASMNHRPHGTLSKHPSCIIFSLPVATQNVRFLALPQELPHERGAGNGAFHHDRRFKEGTISSRDLPAHPPPEDRARHEDASE